MPRLQKYAAIAIKLGVTAALLYWLYAGIDYASVSANLAKISVAMVALVSGTHVLAFLLGGFRWWLLLQQTTISTPFIQILPSYYLGLFFNNILPSNMGGDVVRVLHLNLRGLSAKALMASTIVDRLIGVLVVLLMGVICLLLSPNIDLQSKTRMYLLALLVAAVTAPVVLLSPLPDLLLSRMRARYQHTRIRRVLLETVTLCHSYRSRIRLILCAAAISLVMQSLIISIYYLLGQGVGIDLPLVTYFAIIPVVYFIASLPISIGGLGVREGVLVGFLMAMHIDRQLAISLSLLYLAVFWVATIPGVFVLLTRYIPVERTDLR